MGVVDGGFSRTVFAKRAESDSLAGLLNSVQQATFKFFWEQGSPATGLGKDRTAAQGSDTRTRSSIAATGFGLPALCIADWRKYQARQRIKERVHHPNFLADQLWKDALQRACNTELSTGNFGNGTALGQVR